jgi:hypothetical protein
MRREKNSRFRILYGSVVGLGLAVIGLALYRIIAGETAGIWVALALLAAVAGSFSLKIPGMNGRVSAGDTITCLSVLLLGPYAGALSAAADALGGSIRCKSSSRRLQFALYNSSNSALSAFVVGQVAMGLLGKPILYHQAGVPVSSLLLPLCVLAGGYYLMNTVLVAVAVALEKSLSFVDVWREGFMWTCVNYLAGAFVAGMLVQVADPLAPAQLGAVLFFCSAVYISCRAHVRLAQRVHRLREEAQLAGRTEQCAGSAAA